jgi:hypothetical protein
MSNHLGVVIAALALSWSAQAHARAEPSPAWDDVLAVEGHLGLGAPLGLAGLAVDVTPHRRFSIGAGVGKGMDAPQLAAMARVRPLLLGRKFALGLGGGASGGDTRTARFGFSDPSQIYWGKAVWLNGEFFMELRHGPFHLRPFVGMARRVAYSSCTYVAREVGVEEGTAYNCADVEARTLNKYWDPTILYTGVAVGWSVM